MCRNEMEVSGKIAFQLQKKIGDLSIIRSDDDSKEILQDSVIKR